MNYDFPVQLEGVKTESGLSVPGKKAVVRTDTGKVLCLVGDSIRKLKTHKSTVEDADALFMGLGSYDKTVFLDKSDLVIRVVGVFKDTVAELASGTDIRMLVMVEHSYEVINHNPIVYVGGFVKKHNTWFVNPVPATKLYKDSAKEDYWNNLVDTRIIKKWEKELGSWCCWDSCPVSYEKAVSMIRSGLPGILNRDKTSHVIRRLCPNAEDEVSVWNMYYSIARAIVSESFSSHETKLKKIKDLHAYINKKFHNVKEV